MAKLVIGTGTKIAGINFDPELLQDPLFPLPTSQPVVILKKSKGKEGKGHRMMRKATSKKVKKQPKQEVQNDHKVKQEVEEVGNSHGEGVGAALAQKPQDLARRASKAAALKNWKEAKMASKREGVLAKHIDQRVCFLKENAPLPPPFPTVALQLSRASLIATLYKEFLLTKAKGNGWKTQWGEAHVLFLNTFKLEVTKQEAEVSRWELKLGALWKAFRGVKGPQLNPLGTEEQVSSALVQEWKRVAQEDARSVMKDIELLEAQVAEEVNNIMASSKELLSQG